MPDLGDLLNLGNLSDPAVIAQAVRMAREWGIPEDEIRSELQRIARQRQPASPAIPSRPVAPTPVAPAIPPAAPPIPALPDLPASVFAPPAPVPERPPEPVRSLPSLPEFGESLFALSPASAPKPSVLEERLSPTSPERFQPPVNPHEWTNTSAMDPVMDLASSALGYGRDALGYLGSSLDKLGGREVRGLLGGHPNELLSFIPFSDELGITDPREITSGRQLLDRLGVTTEGDQGWGAHLGGMAAEAALDPLTLLGGLGLAKRGLGWLGSTAREANAATRLAELAPRSTAMSLSTLDPAMEAMAQAGGRARYPISEHLPGFGPTAFKEAFGSSPRLDLSDLGPRSAVDFLRPGWEPETRGALANQAMERAIAGPGLPASEDVLKRMSMEGAIPPGPAANPFAETEARNIFGPGRGGHRPATNPIHETMPEFGTRASRGLFGRNPRIEGGMEMGQVDELARAFEGIGKPQIPTEPQSWLGMGQPAYDPGAASLPMISQPPARPMRGFMGITRRDVHGNPIMESQVRGAFQGRSGRTYPMGNPVGSSSLLDQLLNPGIPPALGYGTYAAGRANRFE